MNKELEECAKLVMQTTENMRLAAYDDENVFMTLFTMGTMGMFNSASNIGLSEEEMRDTLVDLVNEQYKRRKEKEG